MAKSKSKSKSKSKKSSAKAISPQVFRGVANPTVDLSDGDDLWVKLPGGKKPDKAALKRIDPSANISLDRLRVELENQSYGMISASTGCISAPGGPSC